MSTDNAQDKSATVTHTDTINPKKSRRIPVAVLHTAIDFFNSLDDDEQSQLLVSNADPVLAVIITAVNELIANKNKKPPKKRVSGEKVKLTVEAMISENEKAFSDNGLTQDWTDYSQGYVLTAITLTAIKNRDPSLNPKTISDYLIAHKDEIIAHHTAMGIDKGVAIGEFSVHNRLAGKWRMKNKD